MILNQLMFTNGMPVLCSLTVFDGRCYSKYAVIKSLIDKAEVIVNIQFESYMKNGKTWFSATIVLGKCKYKRIILFAKNMLWTEISIPPIAIRFFLDDDTCIDFFSTLKQSRIYVFASGGNVKWNQSNYWATCQWYHNHKFIVE